MDIHFADWYGRASLSATSEQLTVRSAGVETFIPSLDTDGVLDLVRLYVRLRPKSHTFVSDFQTAIKDQDQTFLIGGNDNELAVLAGAGIAALLESMSPLGDIAALGVSSVSFGGSGQRGPFEDIVLIADQYLSRRRAAERSPIKSDVDFDADGGGAEDLLKAVKAALPGNNAQQIGDAISKVLHLAIAKNLQLAKQVAVLTRAMHIYREEANIAWWVMGEHSRTLEEPLLKLGPAAGGVICGCELATLVEVMPGPHGVKGILARILAASGKGWRKPVSLQSAVNGTPRDWRSSQTNDNSVSHIKDLTPGHAALAASLETEGADDWAPIFETASGIKASQCFEPLELARRVFIERLLIKTLRT
jgi:hypothetical protein